MAPEKAREELRRAGRRYNTARAELEDAVEARDAAIVRASSAGLSRREVAQLGGVTVGRIQQVLDALQADARERLASAAEEAKRRKDERRVTLAKRKAARRQSERP